MILAPAQMSLPRNSSRIMLKMSIFHPRFNDLFSLGHLVISYICYIAHYAENEHFPPPIQRSLLAGAPCYIMVGHCRGKGLGARSNFALPGVVQSINVYHLPHPLSGLSPCSIVPINQWHSEVTRREINNRHDLNILRGSPRVLSSTTTFQCYQRRRDPSKSTTNRFIKD